MFLQVPAESGASSVKQLVTFSRPSERQPHVVLRQRRRSRLRVHQVFQFRVLHPLAEGLDAVSGKRCIRLVSHHEKRSAFHTRLQARWCE
jgi:hypothetical protein